MGGFPPPNPKFYITNNLIVGPTHTHLITVAAALRLGNAVLQRRRLQLGFHLHSSVKNISHLGVVLQFKDIWYKKALQCTGCFQWWHDALPSLSLCLFNGDETRSHTKDIGKSYSNTSRSVVSDGRQWTNILLAANVLVYIAQTLTEGSAVSYWFSKAPAVGASGAIFGLAFGLLSEGIDNWGHLGGLIGGVSVSWLLGPAWRVESVSRNGRKIFTDKAPLFSLIKRYTK